MQAKFIGDPNDDFSGPRVYSFRGVDFPKGKWVPLTDAVTFAKCEGSSHFETSNETVAANAEPGAELTGGLGEDVLEAPGGDDSLFNGAPVEAFDQDGDGQPGGPVESDEKTALIAALEAIPDAQFKRSWGVARLTAALEEARFLAGDDEPAAEADAE
jgi:hypothetical protein